MKVFFQLLIVALLVSITTLAGCTGETTVVVEERSPKSLTTAKAKLRLKISPLVEVQLKGGKSKSGQLKAIDSQKRQLTIELDGTSVLLRIDEVERVTFKTEESLPNSNDSSVMRCAQTWSVTPLSQSSNSLSVMRCAEIWSVTPLSEFRIDPGTGQAEVKREAVTKQQYSEDFLGFEASSYVVKTMWFNKNSPETIKLKVAPEE